MSHSNSRSPKSPRDKSPTPQKRTSLLVRNIVWKTQDQQTKPDELREFFSKYGEVRDVYIPRDYYTQKSRGFCFVEFLKYDDAHEALDKTDGTEVLGKTVKIVFAREGRKAVRSN
jgi:RNA recognition motif-containing protein